MSFFKKIIHELNYVKLNDIAEVFVLLISVPGILFYKLYLKITKKEIWLVSEDKMEARDNGFRFFRYLNDEHPEINSYYAISPKSGDFNKVIKVGKYVKFGSIKHWILYFSSKHNISSQKNGNPNAAVCYVLEVFGLIKSRTIFLQHGITLNKGEWLFYKNTKWRLFICGAKPEYEFVKEYFGYPQENLKYLGFPRFDDYFDISVNKKQIVLMPSWREWIASKNEYSSEFEDTSNFKNTEYYQKYQSLINNSDLIRFLNDNDLTLYFYPHRNMQKYINDFKSGDARIKIVSNKNSDIRKLLIESAVMITDYSSVALDFAYMKKSVIYYQFDQERFRKAQYGKGFFDYKESGLGTACEKEEEVINLLIELKKKDFSVSEEFNEKHREFYPIYDNKNNERIFAAISDIKR